MPKIERIFTLEITPERFVDACSDVELQTLSLELDRELHRRKVLSDNQPNLIIDEEF